MKKLIRTAALTVILTVMTVVPVMADTLTPYQLMLLASSPEYKAALAAQANQAASAANQNAIASQSQADQALLLAIAASQDAFNKQLQANQAAVLAALANQAMYNTIIANNPVLMASYLNSKKPVDPKARNLELLHNINTIDQANIAAKNARAIANTTLARLNDARALLNATKEEVKTNPGLTQRLNELTAMVNAFEAQYKQQDADATAKEATLKKLQDTLPTEGYNPCMWECYY
ncbi:MAG: hypothetical protein K6F34_02180 [Lachnospiraceae bacterium]|nr:hypothetical protein [Lachnospiraceae bacterium]